MHSPLFSVVVPAFNVEEYISSCIEGLLRQTITDFEVLIVDDGSTDETGHICDMYSLQDNRIRVFHQANKGVSKARNRALDNALGKWIVFCDGDDEITPNWLALFKEQMCSEAELLSQGLNIDESRRCHKSKIPQYKGFSYLGDRYDYIDGLYCDSIVGYLFIKAFRRDIVESFNIRFNVAYNYHEDEEFFLRYCKYINKVSCISDSGYIYYIPDWSKYTIRNRYQLFRDKWLSIQEIYSKSENAESYQVVSSYLNDYAYNFMVELAQSSYYGACLDLVRDFRRCLGKSVLSVGLSFITRMTIYMDITGYLSTFVTRIHAKMKF